MRCYYCGDIVNENEVVHDGLYCMCGCCESDYDHYQEQEWSFWEEKSNYFGE